MPTDVAMQHSPTLSRHFARALPELVTPWRPEQFDRPELVVLNDQLAQDLGLDADWLRTPAGLDFLLGVGLPDGHSVAMAYAGHQFGGYSPVLGDGRAVLLGELGTTDSEEIRDIHLKGSGRTPYSRGGDGRAVLGPMLREYLISEAMHHLGIPSTRSLAVVGTGEMVRREGREPGAVLVRVASSHIRVGTFQFAAARGIDGLLRRLTEYCLSRHYPEVGVGLASARDLLGAVINRQAELIAKWMQVGFVHGVMNTDNTTISGETIDYGPCAFIDKYDPAAVFSSIDHGGRYAYGNQAAIMLWNLSRFAETLLGGIHDDPDAAIEVAKEALKGFETVYEEALMRGFGAKLGIASQPQRSQREWVTQWLDFLRRHSVDFTGAHRHLAGLVAKDPTVLGELGLKVEQVAELSDDFLSAVEPTSGVNPNFIPRNHLVDAALQSATAGELGPFHRLLTALRQPFALPQADQRDLLGPADDAFTRNFQTFCGT